MSITRHLQFGRGFHLQKSKGTLVRLADRRLSCRRRRSRSPGVGVAVASIDDSSRLTRRKPARENRNQKTFPKAKPKGIFSCYDEGCGRSCQRKIRDSNSSIRLIRNALSRQSVSPSKTFQTPRFADSAQKIAFRSSVTIPDSRPAARTPSAARRFAFYTTSQISASHIQNPQSGDGRLMLR